MKASKLRTDKGREFKNETLRQLFEQEGVEHFVTENIPKGSVTKHLIKLLKSKYFKYMSHFRTFWYIHIVNETIKAYNRSYHRSIRRRPIDVIKSNEAEVFSELYGKLLAVPKGNLPLNLSLLHINPGSISESQSARNPLTENTKKNFLTKYTKSRKETESSPYPFIPWKISTGKYWSAGLTQINFN